MIKHVNNFIRVRLDGIGETGLSNIVEQPRIPGLGIYYSDVWGPKLFICVQIVWMMKKEEAPGWQKP